MTALRTHAAATLAASLALGLAAPAAHALDLPKGGPSVLVGIYNATPPTLTDGQTQGLQLDSTGALRVTGIAGGGGGGGGNAATTSNATDGQATTATNQNAVTYGYAWNGTGWDRVRVSSGPVAPGTPAPFATLGAGVYKATPPTVGDGQQAALQLDAAGNLKVNIQAGGGGSGGGNAATTSNGTDGQAATATNQQTVAYGYVWNGSGWDRVRLTSGPVAPGTAAPFSTLGGGVYSATAPNVGNGQQAALQLDSSGNLKVNTVAAGGATAQKQPAFGTAASPSADIVTVQPPAGKTPTDRSGSITTGGSSQSLMGANAARRGWWCQNQSSQDVYVNDVGAAASAGGGSIKIQAGLVYEAPAHMVSTASLTVFGAVTGQLFACREY